ncbi:hypothetical protein FKM82_008294 [Ascaphus truei]
MKQVKVCKSLPLLSRSFPVNIGLTDRLNELASSIISIAVCYFENKYIFAKLSVTLYCIHVHLIRFELIEAKTQKLIPTALLNCIPQLY